MDIQFSTKLLNLLIENGLRVLAAGFGVDWAEGSFFDVVRLLREEKDLKPYFLDRVRATMLSPAPGQLEPGTVPPELIELVAHELRWPELLEIARLRIDKVFRGDATLAVGDIAWHLPKAYDDAWEDREFYHRYTST